MVLIDVLKKGVYIGGGILPGIDMSINAPYENTAKLPRVKFTTPSSVLGTDTMKQIQAAIFFGYAGQIKHIIKKIDEYDANLSLKGLYTLYMLNKLFIKKGEIFMGIFDEKIAENLKVHKYEPPRHIVDFHVAGFAYYDGLDVINELSLGQAVTLVVETDNPYDNEAVAIYYKDKKLGYVPKEKNSFLSTLLYYGYGDILEARIQYVNVENHPERQFRVVVKIKDNRK